MSPLGGAGRPILPLCALVVEKIHIPCRPAAIVEQPLGEGLPCVVSAARVVKMPNARIGEDFGGLLCSGGIVRGQHVYPDDAHADVRIREVPKDRFQHRTGAGDARRSGRREQGDEPILLLVFIEAMLERS